MNSTTESKSPSGRPGISASSEYRLVQLVTAVATLGALAFGYDTGVIAGALPFMILPVDEGGLGLNPFTEGLVTSSLIFGAAIGAVTCGRLSDAIGRRRALIVLSVIFFFGALGTAFAPNVPSMVAMRLFLGLGVGGASAIVPIFIGEMAPPSRREALVTRNELMIVSGQLLAYATGALLANLVSNPEVWRAMLLIAAIPALLLWLGMLFVPESPRWLVQHNRIDEARAVLTRLRHDPDQREAEFQAMLEVPDGSQKSNWQELRTPWIRRLLFIGIGLGFMLQFTGVNAFMYFTPIILQSTGLGTTAAITATIGNGVVAVIATLIGIWLISRVNRRTMLTVGLSGIIFSLIGLGLCMEMLPATVWRSYIALGFILLFLFFMQGMVATVYWLMMSELFPQRLRGMLAGISIAVQWIFNATVAFIFPIILDAVGGLTFFVFVGLNILSLLFVIFFLPETRGRTLESIEDHLKHELA